MADNTYGNALIVREDVPPLPMKRLSLSGSGQEGGYDEAFIQELAFEYPNCLPISEIDDAYEDLVPICLELNTQAGPLDALFVTPKGRLVVLEAKLWRNPEARRKVVAQILDYAKELSAWSYEDLQRETSRKLNLKGNALFELVREKYPDTDEVNFVDGVQQSLAKGRFLLLIVGDGIREGAAAIAEFLESVGSLEFTFGLVELALYHHDDIGLLVQPRVIARTVEFRRSIVVLPEGVSMETAVSEEEAVSPGLEETRRFYRGFWSEFISELQLDDVSQPMANIAKAQNLYFPLPPSGSVAWISAYFSKSTEKVGVYLALTGGSAGLSVTEYLEQEKDDIADELGPEVSVRFVDDRMTASINKRYDDVNVPEIREETKKFFAEYVNRFVNAFRPRLKRFVDAVG